MKLISMFYRDEYRQQRNRWSKQAIRRWQRVAQPNASKASPLPENFNGVSYRCDVRHDHEIYFLTDDVFDLLGYPASYFSTPQQGAKTFGEMIHDEDRADVYQKLDDAIRNRTTCQLNYRIATAQGDFKWVWEQCNPIIEPATGELMLEGFMIDMTRFQTIRDLNLSLYSLFNHAPDAIFITDEKHNITYWNNSAEKLYGWNAAEVQGRNCCDLLFRDREAFVDTIESIVGDDQWRGDVQHYTRDGDEVLVLARYARVSGRQGGNMLFINTDVTQVRESEHRMHRLAFFDTLTNLPNRSYFMDKLSRALAANHRNLHLGTLMFIDLDNFKILNDTCGHGKGDLLLTKVACSLQSSIRDNDFVARLGGDEFVILMENDSANDEEVAFQSAVVAHKLLAAICQPFDLGDNIVHRVSGSIGVTFFQAGQVSSDDVLKQADMAMYQAKLSGRNQVCYFDEEMHQAMVTRMEMERQFAHAMAHSELVMDYQPQVNRAGEVVGVEALVRWNHPQRGLLKPRDFLFLIEPQHYDAGLCEWVLRQACAQLVEWSHQPGMEELFISVNLSAKKFKGADFPSFVIDILKSTGANPALLKLELPEAVFAFDVASASRKMLQLKEYGVRFSLDDFGTATSSLSILNQLPFDEIKIDSASVARIDTPFNAALVRSMLAIGNAIGMNVVAEGVETDVQRRLLVECGCKLFQGTYFHAPMQAEQLPLLDGVAKAPA